MDKVALGYVNFDSSTADSGEVEIIVPHERIGKVRRGQYVRIESESSEGKRSFFARISKGPFFTPDSVSKDSAFARVSVLNAGSVSFKPDYHASCHAHIMGELDTAKMRVRGTFVRPMPQGAAYQLTGEEIEKLLELEGDMFIGHLNGYDGVRVRIPSTKNAALPRNVGIFGTVGSGKTNTSQVLIEEAASHNWAVIVLDIEGEYVDMDKPSKEPLDKLFSAFSIEPGGIDELDIYHPIGTEPARDDCSSEFGVRFSNVDPQVLSEIMGLTQPQNDRFAEAWYKLAQKKTSSKRGERVSAGFASSVMGDLDSVPVVGVTLKDMVSHIESILEEAKGPDKASHHVLRRKLNRLDRIGVFDKKDLGDYGDLVKSGKVSVIDMSGSYSNQINNIVLMDLLGGIFRLKLKDRENKLPSVFIAIEEAHTLVSRENAGKMEETLDVLREISRRGRKRRISLCFISQQPSHLPPEIYELCNTKIAHQTTGGKNLDAIKGSAGGVDASVWGDVPRLGQGTCLFISSYFKNRPMVVDVRPCKSSRRHVEEE